MTAVERLRELEQAIADAETRQRQLRAGKEQAARDVAEARGALVAALERDLDASASQEQKALQAAEKRASEPWSEKIEAAGRLVAQAQRKRGEFIAARIDDLLAEMAAPAAAWPDRARQALDQLREVMDEYERIGMPLERLAREAGRQVRIPDNPLDRHLLTRQAGVALHAPLPAGVKPVQIDPLDDPDDAKREAARARFREQNRKVA